MIVLPPADALLTLNQAAGFLLAAVAITLAPGPDNLMVLGLGMSRGPAHGVAFGLGCALGCITHTVLAALGVGAAIAASPTAFGLLKAAGALYLIWLGLQAWRHARPAALGATAPATAQAAASRSQLFRQGLLANAINPKVVVFFLAFLPQFVNPAGGMPAWQMAQLGLLFTLQAAVLFATLGAAAGWLGRGLARRPMIGAWLDRLAGALFMLLGLRLLWWA